MFEVMTVESCSAESDVVDVVTLLFTIVLEVVVDVEIVEVEIVDAVTEESVITESVIEDESIVEEAVVAFERVEDDITLSEIVLELVSV